MKKNAASQSIGAEMITAADGSDFTGTVTVYVTGDNGTQALGSVGSGVCTHEGNGYHSYAPAQAETNYDHIAFTFIGSGAISATIQMFTNFPQTLAQTGDSYARLGAPAGASVSADVATRMAEASINTTAGAVDNVTLVATTTTNTDMVAAAPTAASVADAVLDEALSGHVTAGTLGKAVADIEVDTNELQGDWVNGGRLDNILDARMAEASINTTAGAVDNVTLVATTTTNTDMVAAAPTAAANADAVWDEATVGHTTGGTFGEQCKTDIDAILVDTGTTIPATLGTPAADISADIAAVKVDTAATLVDTADMQPKLGTPAADISADIAAAKVDTAAIKVKTDSLTFTVAGNVDSNVQSIADSTTTGAAFNRAVKSNVIGTVGSASTTTSVVSSSLTPAGTATDQFVPRYLVFADDTTTAALRGQATDITASTASATPTFTVTALTTAPVSGDTFVIL